MSPPGINKSKEELVVLLRTYLGDSPEENRIIPGKETSDDKLSLALDLALDEYNNTPPFETRTFQTFPSLITILSGAAIQALVMAGLVQSRNHLQFSDGRFSTVIEDKSPAYQAWINQIIATYQRNVSAIKTSLNMERNFGVISSPYGNVMDF